MTRIVLLFPWWGLIFGTLSRPLQAAAIALLPGVMTSHNVTQAWWWRGVCAQPLGAADVSTGAGFVVSARPRSPSVIRSPRFRLGGCRPCHAGAPGMAWPPQHQAYRPLYGAGTGSVQGVLEGLTSEVLIASRIKQVPFVS
jgi:hypothetical protein